MPIFRREVLWYGDVRVSVRPSLFHTFLLYTLTYWTYIMFERCQIHVWITGLSLWRYWRGRMEWVFPVHQYRPISSIPGQPLHRDMVIIVNHVLLMALLQFVAFYIHNRHIYMHDCTHLVLYVKCMLQTYFRSFIFTVFLFAISSLWELHK